MSDTAENYLRAYRLSNTYWGMVIIDAERRGRFAPEKVHAAASWVTCACGRLDDGIPRQAVDNSPVDHRLRQLGGQFHVDVASDRFLEAAKTLKEIEDRAKVIINGGAS